MGNRVINQFHVLIGLSEENASCNLSKSIINCNSFLHEIFPFRIQSIKNALDDILNNKNIDNMSIEGAFADKLELRGVLSACLTYLASKNVIVNEIILDIQNENSVFNKYDSVNEHDLSTFFGYDVKIKIYN